MGQRTRRTNTPSSSHELNQVRIDVLGPLKVSVVGDDLVRSVDVDWSRSGDAILRELASSPEGAMVSSIERRTGLRKPYDAVGDLRKTLQPFGLSVSRSSGSQGYRLINLSGDPVSVESDIVDFRAKAGRAIEQEEALAMAEPRRPEPVPPQKLVGLAQQTDDALALWRVSGVAARRSVLLPNPAAKTTTADYRLDNNLRVIRARIKLTSAERTHSEAHLLEASSAINDVDDLVSPIEIQKLNVEWTSIKARLLAEGLRRRATESEVFLSIPMSAATGYESMRALGKSVADALCQYCGVRQVFCAAETIASRDEFEEPPVALQTNLGPFQSAVSFVMIYPEKLASSVLVEAGMALAFGMPSVYFVRNRVDLPWMLQDVAGAGLATLGVVRIIEYRDEADLLKRIRNSNYHLFPKPALPLLPAVPG